MVGKRCMFAYGMGQIENWNEWKFTVVLIKRSFIGIMIPPDSWLGHCDKRGLILKRINSSPCAEKSQWAEWTLSILFEWLCIPFPLEKLMAPHSSTLAWKIPRMEEPGRRQSMGLRRVQHDWATSLSLKLLSIWWPKRYLCISFLCNSNNNNNIELIFIEGFLWAKTMRNVTYAALYLILKQLDIVDIASSSDLIVWKWRSRQVR